MLLPCPAGRRLVIGCALLLCTAGARAAPPPPAPPELQEFLLEREAARGDVAAAPALEPGTAPGAGRTVAPPPPLAPPIEEIPLPRTPDADGVWSLLPPPSGRYGHSIVLDPVRRQLVMFGGSGDIVFDELWLLKLDGAFVWSGSVPAGPHPSPRQGHRTIYDPARDRVILYGGYNTGVYFDDVWELRLDGAPAWRFLGYGPPPRAYPAMVLDPETGTILVHGGFDGVALDDLWRIELGADGVVASPIVTPEPRPSARTQHTAVLDPARRRLLLFGGQAGEIFNDTWILKLDDAPAWTPLPGGADTPGPRYGQGAVLDPRLGRVVLFGGYDHLNQYLADSWAFDFDRERWEQFFVNSRPGGRVYPGFECDPVTGRVLMFGGFSPYARNMNDLWSLDLTGLAGWVPQLPGGTPPLRAYHTFVRDPRRDRLAIYGGYNSGSNSIRNDTWFLDNQEPARWIPSDQPPMIGARTRHSAIVDPVRDRMIVFGGWDNSTAHNDVWALPLDGNGPWTEIRPTGEAPISRVDHAAVYDPVRDRMIIMGGFLAAPMNDTWALNLSGPPVWTPFTPVGLINGRGSHVMVYDSRRDRIIVFGGDFNGLTRNDTWALWLENPPRWERLRPVGALPPPTYFPSGIYDPIRDRLVVYAYAPSGIGPAELWSLPFTGAFQWRRLAPIGVAPESGVAPRVAYDAAGDRMLVQAGSVAGVSEARVWALDFHPFFGARAEIGAASGDAGSPADPGAFRASPNPARDRITCVIRAEPGSETRLRMLDLAGRTVRRLDNVPAGGGPSVREWDLRDESGVRVAPGVYLAIAESSGRRIARRIVVLE